MPRKQTEHQNRQAPFDRLRGLFAGFAHEVRNPLSTIGLNLGLIKEDFVSAETPRDKRTFRRLTVLETEVKRLQKILDEFLQFVRNPELKLRPVDPNTLLAGLVDFMEHEAAQQGIALRFYPGQDVGMFEIDADLFRAMVVNLVRNAMQACCKGDEILVSTIRQGSDLIVRVTDTGPGMDAKTRESAFVPYFSTKKDGTGLGLSIVRRIVEAHGGSIHLSTEPGKGTQFTLLFPSPRMIEGAKATGGSE